MKNKFNYFNEAETDSLRFWNIAVTLSNLNQDFGQETAREYVAGLSQMEQAIVGLVLGKIQKMGMEEARKEILGMVPVKDGSVYDARVQMDAPEQVDADG